MIHEHFCVIIDWSSIGRYQSMPINRHASIGIDWSIAFPIIDFHRLGTPWQKQYLGGEGLVTYMNNNRNESPTIVL